MRILAFTNIPMPAVIQRHGEHGIVIGGWLGALQTALAGQPNLAMGYASVLATDYESFTEGNATYFNIRAPATHRGLRAWYDAWQHSIDFPGAVQQCRRIVEQFRPDVIHIHGTELFFGLIQSFTAVPVVISLQGLLTIYSKRFFAGLEMSDVVGDVCSPSFVKGHGLLHQYWTMKKAATREHRIVVTGKHFVGRTAWDRGFVSLLNPHAHYYECDEVLRGPFYTGRWDATSLHCNTIYCVTGANPYKGLECLLEAVKILEQANLPKLTLKISGTLKGTHMWRVLEKRVRKLQLTSEIVWLGASIAETVVSELEHASVFVLPSHIENSPNSLAEAMLVGTPCVASYVGGVPSLLDDGKEGLCFPAGDAYALAARIAQILADSSMAKQLSQQASIRARTRHDPQRIAGRMMDIYHNVILNHT